ncbi:YqaJ viral recombinase family protein [Cellulomonas sp. ACRRI]|uniref:lambda exonuclease family protein n=1 Tax=Cellulomonas sp. ACRRI TaxID=2918188 RepID=UPI001EF1C261|nr:lambda exonuclease family protein [Cellulomonas sp. ACRRI]MCG7285387.1 YqaJ viral recombinase family protein [Cellulomonas sp. ACRRI]
MTLHVYNDLEQGSDAWLEARRGIVTASVVGQLISVKEAGPLNGKCPECGSDKGSWCVSRARKEPTPIKTFHASRTAPPGTPPIIDVAHDNTADALTRLLVAERITGWVDPVYVSDDMMRGTLDEPIARAIYAEHYAPVDEVGFMVRDDWGFRIGYSPDGLVGDKGLIEIKSRRAKKQLDTILRDEVPAENMAQIQCGIYVSGREWCDYVSFCGGMPLYVKRVEWDEQWQRAIVAAVQAFEEVASEMTDHYTTAIAGRPATQRIDHFQEASL